MRDPADHRTTFSAYDLKENRYLWRELVFDEKWWITLEHASGPMLFLSVYMDQQNPAAKSLVAFNFESQQMAWWRNHFLVSGVHENAVTGKDTLIGDRQVVLALDTGRETADLKVLPLIQNFLVDRPFQYHAENAHFSTIRSFVFERCGFSPVSMLEYLESDGYMIISCYAEQDGLANFLLLFDDRGNLHVREKIGEQLKGLGMDTFFVFSGYLIFVKNKSELVSYRLC